jgi:IclR family pca regulon transcriptional regulator
MKNTSSAMRGENATGLADSAELETSGPKPGDSYVRSFARGLAVLRSFGADAQAQTLTEVAERAGLTRAGARRILLTLLSLGYVAAEGRLFRLTPKVLELGFAYLTSQPVWTQAQPVMEALVEELRQSSSAAVLDGNEIVYVLRIPAHKIMSINLGVGSRLPADCSSMGRVLLAGLAPEQLRQRIAGMNLVAHTPNTIVDPEKLLAAIEQVRVQGWSLVVEELEPGLVSMAAPIYDHAGRVVAAINISGHARTSSAEHLLQVSLPRLLAAAAKINMLMGARK